jgi:hypothetical protein
MSVNLPGKPDGREEEGIVSFSFLFFFLADMHVTNNIKILT